MKDSGKKVDFERETRVLLEDIRSNVRTLAEGQAGISDKLDTTIGMVVKNTESITMLDLRLIGVEGDVHRINGKLGVLDGRVNNIEADLAIVKKDVKEIKENFGTRLTRLETLK